MYRYCTAAGCGLQRRGDAGHSEPAGDPGSHRVPAASGTAISVELGSHLGSVGWGHRVPAASGTTSVGWGT